MRWKLLIGVLVAVVVTGVATVALRSRTDAGVQRVHDLVDWDPSCMVVIDEDSGPRGWERAEAHASIRCEHLGPIVHYARYDDDEALRRDVLEHPPSAATCIAGREVVVDYLDPGQFAALCRDLHGDRIDAVSALPEPASDGTVGGIERAAALSERRAAAAQAAALQRYFRG